MNEYRIFMIWKDIRGKEKGELKREEGRGMKEEEV